MTHEHRSVPMIHQRLPAAGKSTTHAGSRSCRHDGLWCARPLRPAGVPPFGHNAPLALTIALLRIVSSVLDLVYWRTPLHSGIALALGLCWFFAVGILGWSSLGFCCASAAYAALASNPCHDGFPLPEVVWVRPLVPAPATRFPLHENKTVSYTHLTLPTILLV